MRHRDKFKSGADDQTLLAFVGKEKLVFVTTDQRQRSRHVEREQIKLHKVRQFVFTSGNMGKTVLIKALMNACHQMRRLCSTNGGPFVASISKSGNVSLRTLLGA